MSADSCALTLGSSVRTYERVLRLQGRSRFELLSLLSWLLLMAQTTSTEYQLSLALQYSVFRLKTNCAIIKMNKSPAEGLRLGN